MQGVAIFTEITVHKCAYSIFWRRVGIGTVENMEVGAKIFDKEDDDDLSLPPSIIYPSIK